MWGGIDFDRPATINILIWPPRVSSPIFLVASNFHTKHARKCNLFWFWNKHIHKMVTVWINNSPKYSSKYRLDLRIIIYSINKLIHFWKKCKKHDARKQVIPKHDIFFNNVKIILYSLKIIYIQCIYMWNKRNNTIPQKKQVAPGTWYHI